MKKQEVTNLIKEAIESKLVEHKLTLEVNKIYETRQDLQSVVLLSVMEELSGKKIPDPTVLDEGVWEKAKAMLAKIRLSKSTGAAKQRDALEAAADKAANQKFSQLMSSLKQMPGFDKYPNNESEEEFVGITTAIGLMHQAVSEAHKDGMIETDTANSLISNLKSYADGLNKDLSYSYRYLNEDDEEDTLDEGRLNERDFTNYNKVTKFLDLMDGGKAKPFQARKVKRVYQSLEKEFNRRGGFEGMTNKERDLLKMMRKEKGVLDAYTSKGEFQPKVDFFKDRGGGGGGAKGGGASPDDLGPELGPEMDPGMEDEFGNYSDDGDRGFADSSPLNPMSPEKFSGIGDIDGVSSLPKLYQKAGSMATLSSWLGPGFLQSLAGFALPVAGIAGIAGLVGKRLMGKSREGSLKKLSGMMAPVDASEQGTEAPEPAGDDSGRDLEGEKRFSDMAASLTDPDTKVGDTPSAGTIGSGVGTSGTDYNEPKGSGAPAAAGGAPKASGDPEAGKIKAPDLDSDPMKGGGPPPRGQAADRPPEMISSPDLDSDPKDRDEEEEEARMRAYDAMQEVKRWQKIAGIIKG